jgi:aromatic ring-opening dioxygenase LigB subunit
MSLVFSAFCPHPPLLIPEVGKDDRQKVKKTIEAYEQLGGMIGEADPEVIVLMSPHNLVYPDAFNINTMKDLKGDFNQFDAKEISFSFKNDLDLAAEIIKKADREKIKMVPYDNEKPFFELDHGTLVPLYFLTGELPGVEVLPIAYSFADKSEHFIFGQMLSKIFSKYPKRVAFIASGDMSHRLLENSRGREAGEKFDQTIMNSLSSNDPLEILEVDQEIRELAGECGYNSLVTLLGVLDQRKYKPEVLSYEGPLGVGYLVCNFKLQ